MSSSSAIKPSDNETICNTLAAGRRLNESNAKRQAGASSDVRDKRSTRSSAHAKPANSTSAEANPPAVQSPSFSSPVCHSSSVTKHTSAIKYPASVNGCGTGCSRRITRLCGTFRSCSTGGTAKPSNKSKPVSTPCNKGSQPGAGNATCISEPSHCSNKKCAPNPTRAPIKPPASAINKNSIR